MGQPTQGGHTKFQKGQSGNPGGRRKESKELQALAEQYSVPAFLRIIELSQTAEDARVKLHANQYIVDRAYGKPAQAMSLENGDGSPLQVSVTIVRKEAVSES